MSIAGDIFIAIALWYLSDKLLESAKIIAAALRRNNK